MNTVLLEDTDQGIQEAGQILRLGGLAAIPTETVYGLAADALNEDAVKSIFAAKGRPADNPLIVHIAELEDLESLTAEIPDEALRLAEKFWPGPLTMILKKSELVSKTVSGGLDTVAIRLPRSETARRIIKAAGRPLAAPSANTSGRPSPTAWRHAAKDLSGKIDAVVCGGDCPVGVESTVLSLADLPIGPPVLLRPGGVTLAQLEEVIGTIKMDSAVLEQAAKDAKLSSPGMKYKHYAPRGEVIIVDSSPEEYVKYVEEKADGTALCFDEDMKYLTVPAVSYGTRYDGQQQAAKIFDALHRLDRQNAGKVYARIPSKNGVGLAVYNRLIRSAGFKIVNPYGRYIIGLTGQSGAGKSTVGRLFESLGCGYVDCDEITKSPGVYDEDCIKELRSTFGDDIIENDVLNRRRLAEKAFASEEGKERLNAITHPRIMKYVRLAVSEQLGHRLVVVDAPTLFESGLDSACSRIVVVTASEEKRIMRITERDNITREEAMRRIGAQRSQAFYTSRADHIVNGEGGYDLKKRLLPIVRGLKAKCGEFSKDERFHSV